MTDYSYLWYRVWTVLGYRLRVLWGGVALPLGACLLFINGMSYATKETRLGHVAGALQLAGTIVVVVGLMDRRQFFGERPFRTILADWLDEVMALPFRPKPISVTAMAASAAVLALQGKIRMRVKAVDLGARVEQLEVELDALHEEIDRRFSEAAQQQRETERRLQASISELRGLTDELGATFRRMSVGSLSIELAALGWIIVGQSASTFPELFLYLAR